MNEESNTDDLDLEIIDAPETEAETIIVEPEVEKRADPGTSVDDAFEDLKRQLGEAKGMLSASDRRAQELAQQAHQASMRAQESEQNLVNNAISSIEQTQDVLKDQMTAAYQEQDFSLVADIQVAMATNAANLSKLRDGKQAMEAAPKPEMPQFAPSDPVEALASQISANGSPRSADWVRAHPDYARDPSKNRMMIAAHDMAMARGFSPDTDAYFEAIEKTLGLTGEEPARQEPERRQSAPAAAPVSRGGGGTGSSNPNRVTLSADEREIAKMMGQTEVEYAQNKLALQREGKLH